MKNKSAWFIVHVWGDVFQWMAAWAGLLQSYGWGWCVGKPCRDGGTAGREGLLCVMERATKTRSIVHFVLHHGGALVLSRKSTRDKVIHVDRGLYCFNELHFDFKLIRH